MLMLTLLALTSPHQQNQSTRDIQSSMLVLMLKSGSDSDGVDVMLAEVPDSTTITTVTVGSKKGVEEITETEFNTVWTPYNQAYGSLP